MMYSELPTSGLPTSRQSWGRQSWGYSRKQTNNVICTLPQFTIIFFEPIFGQCVMLESLTLSFQHILPPFHISPSDRCTNIVFAAMHRGRQSYSNCSNQSPAFHTLQISIAQSVGRVLMLQYDHLELLKSKLFDTLTPQLYPRTLPNSVSRFGWSCFPGVEPLGFMFLIQF